LVPPVVTAEFLIILALLLTAVLVAGSQQLLVQLQLTVVLEVAVQLLQLQEMLRAAQVLLATTSVVLGRLDITQLQVQPLVLLGNREALVEAVVR
jgi:hypothetical protein